LPEEKAHHPDAASLQLLLKKTGQGGLLILEPALPKAAQNLSWLRNELADPKRPPSAPLPWFGPCLHAGVCPLSHGRDWCHFSVPATIPGRWFRSFSVRLGSERQWLKYSYLWLRSADGEALPRERPVDPRSRLVITDSLRRKDSDLLMVLLCEPEKPRRITRSVRDRIGRGDIIQLSAPEKPPRPGPSRSGGRRA
jgi:hypothetical protein